MGVKKNKVKIPVSNKSMGARIYEHRWFYVMFLPVLIFVILFNYYPMLGVRFAFTNANEISYSMDTYKWVGFDNFTKLWNKAAFRDSFVNTLRLSIIKLLLNTFMAVVISLLLNEIVNLRFKKTVQTIIYLPHFMSWVVVASIFKLILSPSNDGLVNTFLVNANIINKDDMIYFLADKTWWRPVFYIINIWKDTGWSTILYLATLSGIDPGLYEAAQIDGANRWGRMKYITLPSLANTIITVLILNLAKVMNLFEPVFVLINDSVVPVADVIQTYIYRQTFGTGIADFGYTTAVGLFRSLVGAVLVLGCNYASKKVRGRGII